MTEEEIAVKFTALGGDVIGKDQCKKLQSFIMSIETAENLDGLFELTTAREQPRSLHREPGWRVRIPPASSSRSATRSL